MNLLRLHSCEGDGTCHQSITEVVPAGKFRFVRQSREISRCYCD
jgi:hypothetical protein